ncbi:MAG TPA: diguanylate cyclase [Thermoanaerobaculia bacterium]
MPHSLRLACAIFVSLAGTFTARAIEPADIAKTLNEAERIHATDPSRSRTLLDGVNRALVATPDPRLVARTKLLECTWATTDRPAAYRALAVGLPAAERAGDLGLQAKLVSCRGVTLLADGRDREAETDQFAAVTLARRGKDPLAEADALWHLGELQYNRGAMADALANLQSAYRMNERLGRQKQRLDALAGIANVYADAQVAQYDRAIEYYHQLATGYAQYGQPNDVADTLFNLGATNETKGDLPAAEGHYRDALAAFEKLKRADDIAYTKRALGSSLMKQSRAQEALVQFNAALAFYERDGNDNDIAHTHQFRGMAYRRLGRFTEALQDLAAARAYYEKEKNIRFIDKNVEEAALVYAQLGDWRNAYEFRTRHLKIQQELAGVRRDELSSRLRVEFDAGKKEQENRALARENKLRETTLHEAQRNQQLQRIVIALTALLAIALAVLFWRQVANTRRVRNMALTDELTQLPNRRHILDVLDAAMEDAKRHRRPAAVIAFDIDRFKRINDTHGHAAGDTVLRAVAQTCKIALRPIDQIGRIGGEEFLIVLLNATSEQAFEIAERLRTAVENLDFSSIEEGLRVTISLGVWITEDYEPHAAIAAADSLLYRAKESGRNRIELGIA